MNKQNKYKIVCYYPSDIWVVQERMPNGDWMECHRCEGKGKEGLEEAEQWLKDKEEEQ